VNRFDFGEFPALVLFDQDEQIDYDEQPAAASIVKWVKLILSPAFKTIGTVS
jgi:hypothetical protein